MPNLAEGIKQWNFAGGSVLLLQEFLFLYIIEYQYAVYKQTCNLVVAKQNPTRFIEKNNKY